MKENFVKVEKQKKEDLLSITTEGLDKFKEISIEDKYKDRVEELKAKIADINELIKNLMDMPGRDGGGEISVEDGSNEEEKIVAFIEKKVNDAFSNFLNSEDATYSELITSLNKIGEQNNLEDSVNEIKKMLEGLKKRNTLSVFAIYKTLKNNRDLLAKR